MHRKLTRRDVLIRGLGAAGVVVGRGLRRNPWAGSSAFASELPDRSRVAPTAPVAVQRCASYEPQALQERLDAALDLIGGIQKLVGGKVVTVKVNMTGPVRDVSGLPASRTYHIHPHVVAALCRALSNAGARRIAVVEALYYREPVEEVLALAGWELKAIESAGDHKVVFENTKNRGSWRDYSRITVPWGGYLFPAFDVNRWYEKTDVFVSLSKLKEHGTAGVTMASKNLFGILPTALYGDDAPNEDTVKARGALLHRGARTVPDGVPAEIDRGTPRDQLYRVPRTTADVVGARPVDLAIVDGIDTIRGGEGFWNKGVAPIQPKLLLAGRNPVCTDAVCTAVMGFDPTAPDMQPPFPGENHLRLLAAAGVGTHDLDAIEVLGLSVQEALHPFGRSASPEDAARPDGRAGTGLSTHAGYCPAQCVG